jgi:hypothetical protein
MDWTISTNKVFYSWLEGGFIHDYATGDDAQFLLKADDGEFSTFFAPTSWAGDIYVSLDDEKLGDTTTTFRVRVTGDDIAQGGYDGTTLSNLVFYGMKDLKAPVSSISMSGTFNEVYGYYTSEVAVQITANDDVTGVAAIYYELDGVQKEYTRPFVVDGDGTHTLCYWAVDNEGNVEAKKCVESFRIAKTGPTLTITGPAPGIHILGRKLLDSDKYVFLFGGFEVTASVTQGTAPMKTVEFYFNGELVGEDTAAPYKLRISEKNKGPATIKVVAMDVLGYKSEKTLEIDNYVKLF